MTQHKETVLIWGIAGASLGMEIAKALAHFNTYSVYGADISPLAYGHFSDCFQRTFVLDPATCVGDVCAILADHRITYLIAGGDLVARLCSDHEPAIRATGATYAGNNASTVGICADKYRCFQILTRHGIPCPATWLLSSSTSHDVPVSTPVIVKPRRDSGGSRGIRICNTESELNAVRLQLHHQADAYVCQEYIRDHSNELTIGVLSTSNGHSAGAIVLRRTFQCVLSVHDRSDNHLISSGSSQGEFFRDQSLEAAAMEIADTLGSTGPLNIQCRLKDGVAFPFEINPRFSASTYLRTLAGVNEVGLFLQHLSTGEDINYPVPREGLALRSYAECFVPRNARA